MSRYLIAANLKRQALAASLARTLKDKGNAVLSTFGQQHKEEQATDEEDDDVNALIAASMAELNADALPAENANLDELDDLAIEGDGDDAVDEDPNKEFLRRKKSLQARAAERLAAKKAVATGANSNLTASMQGLNDVALKKARAMIVKRFATPLDLDESTTFAYQLQKQSTAATSQLNGAVQTKLDALKRAADLMDESSLRLTRLSETMREIDTRIAQTNTVIRNYEHLRRVSNVRDNLHRVIAQIDFFTKVPEVVQELLHVLDTDPTRTKEVFLESIKLESLHSALVKEIKTNKGRRESMQADEGRHGGRGGAVYSNSDEATQRMIEAVEAHLSVVPQLSRKIREQIWNTINSYDQMLDVAAASPQSLVASFEIVEMHQEYMDRRLQQAQNSGELEGMDPDSVAQLIGYEQIAEEAQARLKSLFEGHVEAHFLMTANEAETMKAMSKVLSMTKAAQRLYEGIVYFKDNVDPCIPPKYNSVEVFVDVFEDHLLPEAQAIMRGISDMNQLEMLRLIYWFDVYMETVTTRLEVGIRPNTERFEHMCEDLMDEYINKFKVDILALFQGVRDQQRREAVIRRNKEDDTAVSDTPQTLYKILDVNLNNAKDLLPRKMLHKPITTALQCLQEYQREGFDQLEIDILARERADDSSPEGQELQQRAEEMKAMEPEQMCALVNDNEMCTEIFQELGSKYIASVPQDDMKALFEEQLEQIITSFAELANKAVEMLSRAVIHNELADYFTALFTPEWEKGDSAVVGEMAELLDQVLSTSKRDLIQHYYYKLATSLATQTVEFYLNAILHVGGDQHDTYHFTDDILTAIKVDEDYTLLKELFVKYEDDFRRGGLKGRPGSDKSPIEDLLEPIHALQCVLQAGQFQSAEDACRLLYERFPSDGLAIVRCAILFRPEGSLRPQEKKAYEKAAIDYYRRLEAVKKMEAGGGQAALEDAGEGEEDEGKKDKKGGGFFSSLFGFGGKKK